jgi:hypothetical protein
LIEKAGFHFSDVKPICSPMAVIEATANGATNGRE